MGMHIKCKSMTKSFNFYKKLGFNPIFAYGSENFTKQFNFPTAKENYCGVTFAIGDALFEVADGHVAVKPEVFLETVTSSKVSAMFDVESVDELNQQILSGSNSYFIVGQTTDVYGEHGYLYIG